MDSAFTLFIIHLISQSGQNDQAVQRGQGGQNGKDCSWQYGLMWPNMVQGGVRLPNRMNFRKSAKGRGVIFNTKKIIVDLGNFNKAF